MKIKRFSAASMREAMRQVREQQGPDAVILSSHRVTGADSRGAESAQVKAQAI